MSDASLCPPLLHDLPKADGFFPLEHDGRRPFRWSHLRFTLCRAAGQRYLELDVGRPDPHIILTVTQESGSQILLLIAGWHILSIDLGTTAEAVITFEVSRPVDAPGDDRQLGVMIGTINWHADAERHHRIDDRRQHLAHAEHDAREIEGFFSLEHDPLRSYRWSHLRFTLPRAAGQRYLELEVGRPDPHATLSVTQASGSQVLALAEGWHFLGIDLGATTEETVAFEVSLPFQAPGDNRQLGVMIGTINWHTDAERHHRIDDIRRNFALNEAEYIAGTVAMRSIAPHLRITMETRCNIAEKQPCVYCAWAMAKRAEAGAPACDLTFLQELGPHLSFAKEVTDCSIGEPPLNPQFAALVERLGEHGRKLSVTSNGQPLGPRVRKALLGRDIDLNVSLDSATAAGYARYRDDRFDLIVSNLRHLCQEKRAHGNLPRVSLTFIVMQSNKAELTDFISLASDIGVDRVALRELDPGDSTELDDAARNRGGSVFRYDDEPVPIDELERIGVQTRDFAQSVGMAITVEWDNFRTNHGPVSGRPLCSEPWKTSYVLNRGIMPCCYGHKPLAHWRERGERSVEAFVSDTFNSPDYQDLRRSLAGGMLPAYCRSSHHCPIARMATHDATSIAP